RSGRIVNARIPDPAPAPVVVHICRPLCLAGALSSGGSMIKNKALLELSERYRSGTINRRTFIQKVVLAAGGAVAAGEALKKLGFGPGLIREARAGKCDIVTEDLTYPSGQDTVTAYLAKPTEGEPFPTMIVIHEIYGLSDFAKAVARLFACNGYLA